MKKTTAAILALSILVICIFAGCNGAEGGKITEKSTDELTTASGVTTEEDTRNGAEKVLTDAQTRLEELGSNAESRAEEMKSNAESRISDLFNETRNENVNS